VTVSFYNLEVDDLRGFYYTEQIPEGLTVNTLNLKIIDGDTEIDIPDHTFELGVSGGVYPGCIPYRWVIETPDAFDENNPIPPNAELEILYSITSAEKGTYSFDEFSWVGSYLAAPDGQREAFGHSEEIDETEITFTDEDGDTDDDGIPDGEERGPDGTDLNYDGNSDGIADRNQDNVASFHTHDRSNYVTLAVESPVGASLSNCRAVPPPDGGPDGTSFPYGFFEFTVSGAPIPPAETVVKLYLQSGQVPSTYYKYGRTPTNQSHHWYEFLHDGETGAEINGNVIALHFVDGERGDDVLAQDGMIVDQGGPGVASGGDKGSGSGGGGGCFIATAAIGSPVRSHVRILSKFMDKRLLSNRLGRRFVEVY
jgi:hypothetical protein